MAPLVGPLKPAWVNLVLCRPSLETSLARTGCSAGTDITSPARPRGRAASLPPAPCVPLSQQQACCIDACVVKPPTSPRSHAGSVPSLPVTLWSWPPACWAPRTDPKEKDPNASGDVIAPKCVLQGARLHPWVWRSLPYPEGLRREKARPLPKAAWSGSPQHGRSVMLCPTPSLHAGAGVSICVMSPSTDPQPPVDGWWRCGVKTHLGGRFSPGGRKDTPTPHRSKVGGSACPHLHL